MRWEGAERPLEGWVFLPLRNPATSIKGALARNQHSSVFRRANSDGEGKPFQKPYATRRIWLRCVDTGTNRRSQFDVDVEPICASFRRRGIERDFEPAFFDRWAQNWAQCQNKESEAEQESGQVIEEINQEWCARRDSNSRPNAPEAFALSS